MAFWSGLKLPEPLRRALDSPRMVALFRPEYPGYAVEVSSRRLAGVAVAHDKTGARLLARSVVELPPALVQPSLARPAISDPAVFGEHLRRCLEALPRFEGAFSLVLPDRVARITFIDLEQRAPTVKETTELVRWKLKRSTPFRIEDSRISFQMFPAGDRGFRALVALVPGQVVDQFEQVVEDLGYRAGLVDLSSFNLWNLVEPRLPPDRDSLVLNVTEDQVTAMIGRGRVPLFVRCKAAAGETPGIEELRAEIHPTVLYYQDRVRGAGLGRCFLRAPAALEPALRGLLAERYAMDTETAEPHGLSGAAELEPVERGLVAVAAGAAIGR